MIDIYVWSFFSIQWVFISVCQFLFIIFLVFQFSENTLSFCCPFYNHFIPDLLVDQMVFLICHTLCDLLFMKVTNLHVNNNNNYIPFKIHIDNIPLIVFKRKVIKLGLSLLTITSLEVFHLTPNQRYKHLKSSQRFCT